MPDSLYIAATGMQAQQMNVDTIANNLANANTVAFKKGRISVTDLMVQESSRVRASGSDGATESGMAAGASMMGNGVGISSSSKIFDTGGVTQTSSQWDVAIQGDGFFRVTLADGSTAYTRGGTLKVNAEGQLTTDTGFALQPAINIPANVGSISIGADGTVTATVAGQTKASQLGQLQLTRFPNTTALSAQGDNLYIATEATGSPTQGNPGTDNLGSLQQGYLEGSNVTMVDEMVNLVIAQRAYEASSKIVQASDEMMQMVNNLRQ